MPDTQKGLYDKFSVHRRGDITGKHDDCAYFVLDWDHDKFTIPAMQAYADACEAEFPQLSADIRKRIKQYSSGAS